MNYREIKRRVRQEAAEHLYSLEIYGEFDEEDADKVDRAIWELQEELRRTPRRDNDIDAPAVPGHSEDRPG